MDNIIHKTINIHIQPDDIIFTEEQLDQFFIQFIQGKDFTLCGTLQNSWLKFIAESKNKGPIIPSIILPKRIAKYLPNNLKKPGIYSIFAKHPGYPTPLCFYVGMSGINIKERINTHFWKDTDTQKHYPPKGYKGLFYWLLGCTEIFICYSTISRTENNKLLKRKLEFIEYCLDVNLRALFRIGRFLGDIPEL
jgi:hypothetical protein